MRRRRPVLLLALLAACGPEPDAMQLQRDVQARLDTAFPSRVLVLEKVVLAFDGPVDDGIRNDSGGLPGQRDCQYFVTGSVRMTGLSVIPGDQTLWDNFKSQAGTIRELSGLGDEAFAIDNMIYVRTRNLIMLFSALSIDGKGNAVVAELAPKAVARV
jgi:hypothetical protein